MERQKANIEKVYPGVEFICDASSGSTMNKRDAWNKKYPELKKDAKNGKKITLVFDEVSRLYRNEEEGIALYEECFNLGINLVFLKQPYVNTSVFRDCLNSINIPKTNTNVDIILEAVQKYLIEVAKEQIRLAFRQAETELKLLHQRTKEGMLNAKRNGKQIGRMKGKKYISKKSIEAKKIIKNKNKSFGGSNTNIETARIAKISINSLYKYKRELREEIY